MSPKTLLTAFVLLSGTFWCSAFQSFCYHDDSCGPSSSRWGGMCQSGKLQSPINITAAHPDEVADTVTIPLHKFGSYAFYVQNNGHTVYVKFNPVSKNYCSPHSEHFLSQTFFLDRKKFKHLPRPWSDPDKVPFSQPPLQLGHQ